MRINGQLGQRWAEAEERGDAEALMETLAPVVERLARQVRRRGVEIIDFESLRSSAGRLFEGAAHGGAGVSFFVVDAAPGRGPALHRHPYPEVFVVLEGIARFAVADREVDVHGGQILVAPAQLWHRFHNSAASSALRMLALHPAARTETEWYEGKVR
jgi:mannose-6-phosphate isomerase-like protein (cupin superfamily)